MIDAKAGPAADPTLAALVPEPSRARNAVVVALALAAVAGAAWLGSGEALDLRPTVGGAELLPDGRIVYAKTFAGRTSPGMRVDSLRPPAGTRAAAVWLLDADDPDPLDDGTALSAAVAVMEASGEPGTLPQAVPPEGVRLLVVLQVEDCSRLADTSAPPVVTSPPIVSIRSLLGSVSQVDLDAFTWPLEDLEAVAACG